MFLEKVQAGRDMSESEAEAAVGRIMEGAVPPEEMKAWLLALRAKGEALSEVVGAARAMRAHAAPFNTGGRDVVDTCGTGGDNLQTVNLSTLAALTAAGAGAVVAKHGNRSITSRCGSADLLEALGVAVDVEPAVAERCFAQTGFAFLFAPRFHPAMKRVAPIRKELGVPTIFNLLGPLTSPAGAKRQVVGVADRSKMELYAKALLALGCERALVVRGADGQDELSTMGPTEVLEINRKASATEAARYTLVPETFGLRRARLEEVRGGSAAENVKITGEVLAGKAGAVREAVLLNAAAALYVAGIGGDIGGALMLARQSLDSGRARQVLERVIQVTNG